MISDAAFTALKDKVEAWGKVFQPIVDAFAPLKAANDQAVADLSKLQKQFGEFDDMVQARVDPIEAALRAEIQQIQADFDQKQSDFAQKQSDLEAASSALVTEARLDPSVQSKLALEALKVMMWSRTYGHNAGCTPLPATQNFQVPGRIIGVWYAPQDNLVQLNNLRFDTPTIQGNTATIGIGMIGGVDVDAIRIQWFALYCMP